VFCNLDRSSIFLGPHQRNLTATKPDIGVPGDSLLASAVIEGVIVLDLSTKEPVPDE
jgi:hypothetical protein